MTQKGIVKEIKGNYATVSVKRQSACDSCHANGYCVECKKSMDAVALNEVGAQTGDTVELESPTGTVLGYAALVFLMPVVMAIGSFVVFSLWFSQTASLLASLGFFILAFVFIYFYFNKRSVKEKNIVKIIKIIKKDIKENEEMGDIESS